MVEDLLAARGIIVSHETVRRWAEKFGRDFANKIRRRTPRYGDKGHLDEVVTSINGKKHQMSRFILKGSGKKLGGDRFARVEFFGFQMQQPMSGSTRAPSARII